jgi:hypothetical protein
MTAHVAGLMQSTCSGAATQTGEARPPRQMPEHRLLDVLVEADGRPISPRALAQAGVEDPANAIFQLEQAGYRIERAYETSSGGQRSLLGYRLTRALRHVGGPSAIRPLLR